MKFGPPVETLTQGVKLFPGSEHLPLCSPPPLWKKEGTNRESPFPGDQLNPWGTHFTPRAKLKPVCGLTQALLDHRKDVSNTDEMFAAVCDFVRHATNGGTIRPSLAVFRPRQYGKHDFRFNVSNNVPTERTVTPNLENMENYNSNYYENFKGNYLDLLNLFSRELTKMALRYRIWNKFMISYAGYAIEEEVPNAKGPGTRKKLTKIGDQGNLEFTRVMKSLNQCYIFFIWCFKSMSSKCTM
jgi:nitric oxide synthase oxygenase domain/subunit